ncbi:T9SS type A sorting domain-containing protein [Plebeiibacterium marinum]|uniref:T9SS type A sorting domain-containing protein n=1 Tax=Plebeiibacterium marinum TaxID=2992111 RepID=A0AAE3MG76_9BACT|nr:T9SS type A sorting domain-containing protein [Plebeiobacterium marinum]MCW3806432.1 T9SS type A sorting domain-containing protein [Plebeiobacterium marinum]
MKYLPLYFLFIFQVVSSQAPVGNWQEYLSFSNVHSVDKIDNIIYAATDAGLFTYDTQEYIISKYTKINKLSDIEVSTIKAIPNSKKLFIGYENGNIDILENGQVENIPDLKIKSMTNSKRINHVDFINDKAYCATDFGILVVDYNKLEISDFYYIGKEASKVKIYQIAHTTDSIYAASETGLKKADINSSALSFFETWENTGNDQSVFCAVISIDDNIIATKKSAEKYETYHHSNSVWEKISSSSNFKSLQNNGNTFSIVNSNKIEIFYSNMILKNTISNYQVEDKDLTLQCTCIYMDNTNTQWIGDSKNGLIKLTENTSLQILPDGPISNRSFFVKATNKHLWTSQGDHNHVVYLPAEISVFDGSYWNHLTKDTDPLLNGYNNICDIAIDPRNEDHVYLASYGDGILELDQQKVIYRYNDQNSGLQKVYIWELAAGIVLDNEGNLYSNNQEVTHPIVVKPYNITDDKEGWVQYDYLPYDDPDDQTWLRKMIFTSWGDIWAVAATEPNGLFVIDINGTPYDDSDDRYRGPKNERNVTFTDSRYSDLAIWNEEGQAVSSKVICLVEDKSGYIWVGTERGLLVYYRPRNIFDEERPQASRILVPRNDGSGLADYLLENESIMVIEIDGANRKWIGTRNGLFLVSADGTETIHHFTSSNSPLISNIINSISINPQTGEVFIATNKGIVSYMGTATEGKATYNEARVFPNPVYPNYEGYITVNGLVGNSTIKITDVSGKLVFESISDGGQVVWDGRNLNNKPVSSGVYLVFATNEDGEKALATKIMIIR